MLKIIKNDGKFPEVNCKYLMKGHDKDLGNIYHELNFKGIFSYILFKMKVK